MIRVINKMLIPLKNLLICLIFSTYFGTSCLAQNSNKVNIIPYPQDVELSKGVLKLSLQEVNFTLPSQYNHLGVIIKQDLFNLYGLRGVEKNIAKIRFVVNDNLVDESYKLIITDKIVIEGASFKSFLHGWSSLLQLGTVENGHIFFPQGVINDKPYLNYRGLLVDVARKFQSIASLKQIVDICRWYKINYIQLHLNDDQLFVFPSTAFPKLATQGKSYSREELDDLVTYASDRGIVIVPELDAPGHTGTMRKAYPEIFGTPELGMMDVSNQDAIDACKTLALEMIEVFHTSPYFHIGADEVFMREFIKLPQVENVVKAKKFDTPYDLYLDYIIQMHELVKSKGLKTIMWESFENNGSNKVKIPTEILLYAWETMYQTPTSLRDNGYTLFNASWKPVYITPTIRWTLEQIYSWNIWRWEHFLPQAPAWNPIQFGPEDHDKVIGAQLCAWEMTEEMNLIAIQERLAAFAENAWNVSKEKKFNDFSQRFTIQDSKLSIILFPSKFQILGASQKKHERFYNHQNWFPKEVELSYQPLWEGTTIRYTIDGTVPNKNSTIYNGNIKSDSTFNIRLGVFKDDELIGYKTELYEKRPLEVIFKNQIVDNINPIQWKESFNESINIEITSLIPDMKVFYTVDGLKPNTNSNEYKGSFSIDKSFKLRVQGFIGETPVGEEYIYTLDLKEKK